MKPKIDTSFERMQSAISKGGMAHMSIPQPEHSSLPPGVEVIRLDSDTRYGRWGVVVITTDKAELEAIRKFQMSHAELCKLTEPVSIIFCDKCGCNYTGGCTEHKV